MLFSLTQNSDENRPAYTTVKEYLENRLYCLNLKLPPLREHPQDIPGIAGVYIGQFNIALGKEIVGFSPNAMDLMQSFLWPNNLPQLRRIVQELVAVTDTPYIKEKDVSYFLNQEKHGSLPAVPASPIDLSRSLDEISYQIIEEVLKEEHMNKERTAKRLGISRSTLWRILKNHDTASAPYG